MELRETGLVEIKNRIKADKDGPNLLQINFFDRNPTTSLDLVPMLIMLEDTDRIIKKSKRDPLGYPCVRELEIILELIGNKNSYDVRTKIRTLRTIVVAGGLQVADGVFIDELRAVGPFGHGVPDILGMQLILGMTYTDNGN